MQAKPVLLLHTLIGGFLGVTVTLLPVLMTDLLGIPTDANGLFMTQHEGVWVLTAALLAFLIRNEEHSNLRQIVFLIFALTLLFLVIIEIVGLAMAIGNVMMMALIGIHGLFVVLYLILFWQNR